jgi:hypothetical protein
MWNLHCLYEDQCENYCKREDATTSRRVERGGGCRAKHGFVKKQKGKEDKNAERKNN